MKIRIKKIKELIDPETSNIKEGFEEIFPMIDSYFKIPTVGQKFRASLGWHTGPVLEIIDAKTFRTAPSIYEWEIIKK